MTSSGATSYNVYRGTTSGGEISLATGISPTSYTDNAVTNGTTYYYEVKAVNAGGSSPYSNEASATPVAPPSPPTSLAAAGGNAQVSLTWTAPGGATSYNVYRGTTSGGESSTAIVMGISTTSYTDTAVTNGTTYYYEVKAVNAGGASGYSNEAHATPQVAAPSAPTNLTATPGNATVILSWTASSGATTYNAYRGTTAGGENSTAIATSISTTTYTDTTVINGTTYYYKVAAVNAGGTSPYSNEASATPAAVPAAPTGLSASAGNTQDTLTWTAASGATSYNVYNGTSSGGEGSTPVGTSSTTTYTDTGLTNGTKYYYIVKGVNSSGTGPASNEASATPSSAGLPSPWVDTDIGGPGVAGSATYSTTVPYASAGAFTVNGGGANTAGTPDQFNYC
jgi:fibronectin type 3 domain-containing protein